MKCPYCNKEIADASIYCPECGQSLNQNQKPSVSENYWNTVADDDRRRDQEYLRTATRQQREAYSQRKKKLALIISLIALVAVTTFVTVSISNAHNAELEAVRANLPGRELKCSHSQTEAGFWIHYYYYTLKFHSDGTLNYYYLTTVGPANNDDIPELMGTYTYSITRNIIGTYSIAFEGHSFTMKVSDDVPKSISYVK